MKEQGATDAQIERMAEPGELRELVLRRFLRELVEQEGKLEAAEALGINYKTLARHEKSGELTARLSQALELLLLSRDGSAGDGSAGDGDGPDGEERRELRQLERRVAALEEAVRELRRGSPGGVQAGTAGEPAQAGVVDPEEAMADRAENEDPPPVAGLALNPPPGPSGRKYPELVTVEPAADDGEVYGDAWPLVREYRQLRDGHPRMGRGLSWLTVEERLLTVELALLEEHGLTLPPARYPVMGPDRRSHTRWRWKALAKTRRALARRVVQRWVRRVLAPCLGRVRRMVAMARRRR